MELPKLVLELQADGVLNVTGPLHEKLLCLGMLELAKQTVMQAKAASALLVARPTLNGLERR